ncbi:DUF4372 domain-containing protein [Candidatus Desulfovibrio trichonymphae]|uniref:DUF4372 domain-containing protein n=1 Tax=Candidatus Desulfovibrio trichonymphae TaxID=1725232 RepID=UPI0011AB5EB6|nr:DUF4372 domain-containing protein [Candidatus Desulfovibrio trichonymphae]
MAYTTILFSQTLSLISGHVFQKLAHRHKTGPSSRKFRFKAQFTVMAFIQSAARRSINPLVIQRLPSAAASGILNCYKIMPDVEFFV